MKKIRKICLNLKAIQMACLSSAQENTDNAVITLDKETQNNLIEAIKILESLPQDNLKEQWCECEEPKFPTKIKKVDYPSYKNPEEYIGCIMCGKPIKPQPKWKCEVPEKLKEILIYRDGKIKQEDIKRLGKKLYELLINHNNLISAVKEIQDYLQEGE